MQNHGVGYLFLCQLQVTRMQQLRKQREAKLAATVAATAAAATPAVREADQPAAADPRPAETRTEVGPSPAAELHKDCPVVDAVSTAAS
jgi:hypothetical protein